MGNGVAIYQLLKSRARTKRRLNITLRESALNTQDPNHYFDFTTRKESACSLNFNWERINNSDSQFKVERFWILIRKQAKKFNLVDWVYEYSVLEDHRTHQRKYGYYYQLLIKIGRKTKRDRWV